MQIRIQMQEVPSMCEKPEPFHVDKDADTEACSPRFTIPRLISQQQKHL